jgi:subtilisin-like proprotein convertase family protein
MSLLRRDALVIYLLILGAWFTIGLLSPLRADIFVGSGFTFVDATSTQPSGRGIASGDSVISNDTRLVQQINSITLTSLTHTFMGDIRIDLTHLATGVSVILTSPPSDYSSNFNGNYTFVVNSSLPTVDIAASGLGEVDLANGQYAVSSFGGGASNLGERTNFDAFAGVPIEGTWRLRVVDFFPSETGGLGSWSINANVVAVPEPHSFSLVAIAIAAIPFVRNRRKHRSAIVSHSGSPPRCRMVLAG